jgi:hypothetical protein
MLIEKEQGTSAYTCAHVNDLMAVGKPAALLKFEEDIKRVYDITVQKGFKQFIGLDITQLRDSKKVVVSQKGFHKELINEENFVKNRHVKIRRNYVKILYTCIYCT